jgi:hypothetical protein
VQFQQGAPMTASFDLLFDSTNEPGTSVQDAWVNGLLALTNPEATPADGEAAELKKKRPHAFLFSWGAFNMKCVVESVNVTYLMFSSTGTALRARCSVKLKEWVPKDEEGQTFADGTGGASLDSSSIMLVGSGQTLSQVSQSTGVPMRQIAADNKITDPMSDLTGVELKISAGLKF